MSSPGSCAPHVLNEWALMIPPTEFAAIKLETCALANVVLGQEGFFGSDPKLPLEPQMPLLNLREF
jgi:hypothetical protein